jgi:hypothetical protein
MFQINKLLPFDSTVAEKVISLNKKEEVFENYTLHYDVNVIKLNIMLSKGYKPYFTFNEVEERKVEENIIYTKKCRIYNVFFIPNHIKISRVDESKLYQPIVVITESQIIPNEEIIDFKVSKKKQNKKKDVQLQED